MSSKAPPQRKNVKPKPRSGPPPKSSRPGRPKQSNSTDDMGMRKSKNSMDVTNTGATQHQEADDRGGPEPDFGRRERLSIDQIKERATWTNSAENLLSNRDEFKRSVKSGPSFAVIMEDEEYAESDLEDVPAELLQMRLKSFHTGSKERSANSPPPPPPSGLNPQDGDRPKTGGGRGGGPKPKPKKGGRGGGRGPPNKAKPKRKPVVSLDGAV